MIANVDGTKESGSGDAGGAGGGGGGKTAAAVTEAEAHGQVARGTLLPSLVLQRRLLCCHRDAEMLATCADVLCWLFAYLSKQDPVRKAEVEASCLHGLPAT